VQILDNVPIRTLREAGARIIAGGRKNKRGGEKVTQPGKISSVQEKEAGISQKGKVSPVGKNSSGGCIQKKGEKGEH